MPEFGTGAGTVTSNGTCAKDWALICDVDGVLLELTREEEDVFFASFRTLYGLDGLSRDWNSYRCRNDEDIVAECLERHFGYPPPADECAHFKKHYLAAVAQLTVQPVIIPGAALLLETAITLDGLTGIATANYRDAVRWRLQAVHMWESVKDLAFGAEGGGPKKTILGRAIAACGLPTHRIVYMGDNLNDLEAAQNHGVFFIGFSTDPLHAKTLKQAGAEVTVTDHQDSITLLRQWQERL